MTTAQIIIIAILLGLSVISSAAGILQKNTNSKDAYIILSTFFTCVITIILIAVMIKMNELLSNNPCPELEKLENVYKIK